MPPASFKDGLIAEMASLRALAVSLCGSASVADDLVQETLLRAWSKWDQFQPGTTLRAWLFTILRNIYYSNCRKSVREVQDSDGAYAQRMVIPGDQESHVDFEDFRKALARLPVKQREVLILVGASGVSYAEAAAICDVGIGTIKSRLSRARSHLAFYEGVKHKPDATFSNVKADCQSASRSASNIDPLFVTGADGSARPGEAGRGCAAGASAGR